MIKADPTLPLSGSQPLAAPPPKKSCPGNGLWLQGKGKEQDPVACALKPAADQREQESFWDLSLPQSQLRNFLRWLRLCLGGLEHLAYIEICQNMQITSLLQTM